MQLPVVGFDPSLRHWGVARGLYDFESNTLDLQDLQVLEPVITDSKQVRQNSKDIETARQLALGVLAAIDGAKAIFVEVPVGSQSSRASLACGVCLGVLGYLRASGIQFFEITPTEVKLAAVGSKTATKQEMIEWACKKHPSAPWPTFKRLGEVSVASGKAEHMADAIAAIYAGVQSDAFQRLRQFVM